MTDQLTFNRRAHERFKVVPMYSSVAARWEDESGDVYFCLGHCYDISEGGMRLELDHRLTPGTVVQLFIHISGNAPTISVSGPICWCHDEADDPGPCRMAVRFEKFETQRDRLALLASLSDGTLPRAA